MSPLQLGLELTNIFNPLTQAVSALGSLALIDAIKKGGSDALTELKLASILGRNKIDSIIELHFKQVVAKSEKIALSQYLEDVMLESGAGPTVQNALKNKELLSMVIQLSALCYVHEITSLANALIEAIDRNAQSLKAASGSQPDYVSLCGTLRVIQQETAGFRWSYLLERIEQKIRTALEDCKPRKRKKPGSATLETVNIDRPSVTSRRLPFPILQMLLVSLNSLQDFPEERILSIECTSGIATLVVWCHHILGLSVKLLIMGFEITFGDNHVNVFIKESGSRESKASLLLPQAEEEPLFTLASKEGDPTPGPELRSKARGFGHQLLKQSGVKTNINAYRGWVINRSLDTRRQYEDPHDEAHFYTEVDVLRSASFLFDLTPDAVKADCGERLRNPPSRHRNHLSALVLILLSLARVEAETLQRCQDLPFCLYVQPLIIQYESSFRAILSGEIFLDLMHAFEILSYILLGPLASKDAIEHAILVSAQGWSLFFDSINKVDPAELASSALRIEFGVPNRRGVRKTRIIDGPTNLEFSRSESVILKIDSKTYFDFFPGVSKATRGRALISEHGSDAFQVTQSFVWQYQQKLPLTYFLGFREMLDICVNFRRLSSCKCDNMDRFKDTVISYIQSSNSGLEAPSMPRNEFFWLENCKPCKYSEAPGQGSDEDKDLDESVLFTSIKGESWASEIWLFHVSNDPAARWMQICDLYQQNVDRYQATHGSKLELFVRSSETCFRCTIDKALLHCREKSPREGREVAGVVLL